MTATAWRVVVISSASRISPLESNEYGEEPCEPGRGNRRQEGAPVVLAHDQRREYKHYEQDPVRIRPHVDLAIQQPYPAAEQKHARQHRHPAPVHVQAAEKG